MSEEKSKLIDIDRIVQEKAGSKAKYVPGFVLSWLKRVLHQDEVNRFMAESGHERGVEWLKHCVRYLDLNLKIVGEENFPADDGRKYTFVSNHPLGGGDGVALGAVIGSHYDGNICYLLNDILTNLPPLKELGIPINKTGGQSRSLPQLVDAGFRSDRQLLLFPAGICSRMRNGEVKDVAWKKTFITKSVETQRDVVPIHFSGENSKRFYRLANLTDSLHLKFNLAMLFLVDEMYRNVHKTCEIRIGKPIPWQTFDRSRSANDWAQYVRDIVYKL
ncbi:MAG: glycerol acyltransferase [Bacteroidaceae bacterium]|nr:glycerol acyltransferase [Bacteroidaceae bacterium]